MALIKCHECAAQISEKAASCPQCGAQPKKPTSRLTLLVGGAMALMFVAYISKSDEIEASQAKVATAPLNPAKEKADREINIVLAGARMLKESMKKPETFELLSATMMESKAICYQYRARNSFNDRTTGYYVVSDKVSSDKSMDWNRLCANKSGTDYSSVRSVL